MCGLAGIHLDSRSLSPDRDTVERMVRAIGHRGPDGTGVHIEPGVALGHARLSIIDIGGGAQPIHNADQTMWISYNGEVFNYIELRRWLEGRGHTFYTSSDTEVIVHMYEELGESFVQQLNGQFAFALWDEGDRRLLLARDHFGICPLHWSHRGEWLFARMLTADVRDAPPPEAFAYWRAAGWSEERIAAESEKGWGRFASVVSPVPVSHVRIRDGDTLRIGARDWRVVVVVCRRFRAS